MKKDTYSKNIIPFRNKNDNTNIEFIKPNERKIIDLFSSKKNFEKKSINKEVSNQYYINGRSLFYSENYKRAFENLKKAEETGCENTDLYLLLSRCYGINGDIKKSEIYARIAFKTDKNCAEAYYLTILGQIIQNTITEETAKLAVKAIMCGIEADDMIYYYASLFFMDNKHSNFKKAKRYIVSAIDYLQYQIEQDRKNKIKDNDKFRKLLIFYNIKAEACFNLKEYDEALTLYTTCEEKGLIAINIFINKSIIYHENKDDLNALKYIDLAFECYEKSLNEKDEELFKFLNYIKGRILLNQDIEKSIKFLSKSGDLFDKNELKKIKKDIKILKEHNKAFQNELTEIINEIIKILSTCKNNKELQQTFSDIYEHLGEDIINKIINTRKRISDNKFKEFLSYAKQRIKNNSK